VLCDSSDRFRALALHEEHHASPPITYACACARAIAQTSRTALTACRYSCGSRTLHSRSLYLDRKISSKRAKLSLRICCISLCLFKVFTHIRTHAIDIYLYTVHISSTTIKSFSSVIGYCLLLAINGFLYIISTYYQYLKFLFISAISIMCAPLYTKICIVRCTQLVQHRCCIDGCRRPWRLVISRLSGRTITILNFYRMKLQTFSLLFLKTLY